MMLLMCCAQYANKFGELLSGHRTEKCQFSFQSQRKAMPKSAQTTTQLHSSHTLAKNDVPQSCLTLCNPMDCSLLGSSIYGIFLGKSTGEGYHFPLQGLNPGLRHCRQMFYQLSHQRSPKVMLKILQARLQQYVNCELPDVQDGFRKGRGTRDQIANICWITEKARKFQKNIHSCFIGYAKGFNCVDHKNYGKFLKKWEYQTTWPASWEICMQVRKQQLELDMEQQTSSKLGKEYIKAVYCHPAYLTYMQSTSGEMLDWMKHKLESRLLGENQ